MKHRIIIIICIVVVQLATVSGQDSFTQDSIWVNGSCGMCKDRIEKEALRTRGVISAKWDSDTKMLHISKNEKYKSERLHYNMARVGHDTKEMLAPDAVYNALPACCHYRPDDGHDHEHDHEAEHPEYIPKVLGKVTELDENGSMPLPGANIFWAGTSLGVITDEKGEFEIEMTDASRDLVVSYVGYGRDTISVDEPMAFEIEFIKTLDLDEVQIVYRKESITYDLRNPFNVQHMHEKELLKAACCNLSESFETNPAVDVAFTDAVTGTKQIEMLGLAGPYVQITRENMPHIRGLASLYGLTYVPGPWMNGIQINTGSGSVINGFESITGQINVELQKPENSDRLYLNLYGNEAGRMEGNLNLAHSISHNLHTGIMLHGKYQPFKIDHNGDGFMDHPTGSNAIFLNRWKYHNDENNIESQIGIKGTFIQNQSGQTAYDHSRSFADQSAWGAGMDTRRMEGWFKIGKVFPSRPFSSLGFQFSGTYHEQDGYFGNRIYNARQQSLYSNLIYQGLIVNTNHQFKTGASFQYDGFDEELANMEFLRNEAVPGTFFEYTFNYLDKFSLVSGIRSDYHNTYGLFFTPRFIVRYAPEEHTVIRAMTGRGLKTANIFAENIGMLASSRNIIIENEDNGNPYGLKPEIAWNSGVNVSHEFEINSNDGRISFDYYYTWFENQIIVNYDRTPDAVIFQNLEGRSYSTSIQALVEYEIFPGYDVRMAYRFNDVKSTIDGELLQEALTPRHRAFLNMSYETYNGWKMNTTINWQGAKRIPDTRMNPEEFQLDAYSPDFYLINAQLAKEVSKRLEVYLGAENLLNYKQENPIVDAANPFGSYFDASMIWGPVFGRKIYAGLRYRIAMR